MFYFYFYFFNNLGQKVINITPSINKKNLTFYEETVALPWYKNNQSPTL